MDGTQAALLPGAYFKGDDSAGKRTNARQNVLGRLAVLMKLVADIHLHSHFSRATSKNLTLEHLWKWAQLKGVQVVATGDIAHPGWLAELQTRLEPAEDGLFKLKPEFAATVADEVPPSCSNTVRFLIGGEISNIYKKYDRTRKVHNIVFAPSIEATTVLQAELEKIGNIRSDGRPILGLDSRDLLEVVLEVDDRCHLIPAHIWTPWFSILGSKSGFDSLQECFTDLSPHIFAVETGLSSDPPMNWRVSWLDDYTLISNSDAHSPPKLAREATLFDTELSYDRFFGALQSGDPAQFRHTGFSGRGQISSGRPSQVRGLLGAGHNGCQRGSLHTVRQACDCRCLPPDRGVGRPRARRTLPFGRAIYQSHSAAGGVERDSQRRPQFQACADRVHASAGAIGTGAGDFAGVAA